MNVRTFEPLIRDATINVIDAVGRKLAKAEKSAATRLLKRWNALDQEEKENVVSIAIATAITAVSALASVRRNRKKADKSVVKRVAKRFKK